MITQLLVMVVAGVAVAVADAFIKNAISATDASRASMWCVVAALYGVQIVCFAFVFSRRMQLAVAANTQMVLYSVLTIVLGASVFGEHLTKTQFLGVVFAVLGCTLMFQRGA